MAVVAHHLGLCLTTGIAPDADRNGLLWLSRNVLTVRNCALRFGNRVHEAHGSPRQGRNGILIQALYMIMLRTGLRLATMS